MAPIQYQVSSSVHAQMRRSSSSGTDEAHSAPTTRKMNELQNAIHVHGSKVVAR